MQYKITEELCGTEPHRHYAGPWISGCAAGGYRAPEPRAPQDGDVLEVVLHALQAAAAGRACSRAVGAVRTPLSVLCAENHFIRRTAGGMHQAASGWLSLAPAAFEGSRRACG